MSCYMQLKSTLVSVKEDLIPSPSMLLHLLIMGPPVLNV